MKNKKAWQEARKKAKALLSELSLTEKIGQLSEYGESIYTSIDKEYIELYKEGKVGSYLGLSGTERLNKIQSEITESHPHHIPAVMALDVIHAYNTVFQCPLGQSCSWNPEMTKRVCEAQAKEAYRDGLRWTFSPMVDVARDCRWGRIMEGFGEDAYLTSQFAKAAVEGYQGDEIGSKDHLIACMKHFAGYGACESGIDYNGARISKEDFIDMYLPPFKAGVDAGAATFMSAFLEINGIPCTGNKWLLQDILRKKWGFEGFVVSDYGSIEEMYNHGYVKDYKDSALVAFKAGVNMHMAGGLYNKYLPELLNEGKITEEEIDERALEVLTVKELLGFGHEITEIDEKKEYLQEHKKLARESARETFVLLENNGILPLKAKKIAIIGPAGDSKENMSSSWAGGRILKDEVVTIKEAFEKDPRFVVKYTQGCAYSGEDEKGFKDAQKLASWADVVILTLGEEMMWSGESKNRSVVDIPEIQRKLFDAVHKKNKNIVSVIFSGRPLAMASTIEKSCATLMAWLPGSEGGNALLDVLSGDFNPCGKLTTSLPNTVGAIPCAYNRNPTGRPYLMDEERNNYRARYLDAHIEWKYKFGYGLSYSTFTYSSLTLDKEQVKVGDTIEISLKVKNNGPYDGYDVITLYTRDPYATRSRPLRELKGFKRVFLKNGEEQEIHFTLNTSQLAFTHEDLKTYEEPGKFYVWAGNGCLDDSRRAEFEVIE